MNGLGCASQMASTATISWPGTPHRRSPADTTDIAEWQAGAAHKQECPRNTSMCWDHSSSETPAYPALLDPMDGLCKPVWPSLTSEENWILEDTLPAKNKDLQSLVTSVFTAQSVPTPDVQDNARLSTGNRSSQLLSMEDSLCFLAKKTDPPPIENFLAMVQQCRNAKMLVHAQHVHAQICTYGLETHITLGNYIVPMFVECQNLPRAREVFDRLIYRNEHSWTYLISGYCQCGQLQFALHLYRDMLEDSVLPSNYTLVALIKACAIYKDLESGQGIHVEVVLHGLDSDVFVGSTLVDMYAKCCSLQEARDVLDKLPIRNVVSWTAMIAAYAQQCQGRQALECFELMEVEGILPNLVTYACLFRACAFSGAIEQGREMHFKVLKNGLGIDNYVGNALVDMYAKHGWLTEMWEVFENLPTRDTVTWNVTIAGFVDHEHGNEALKCFDQMLSDCISPNAVTFACVLRACTSLDSIDKGLEMHSQAIQCAFERDLYVSNSLIGMYAKHGLLYEARDVLDKLPSRSVVSWTALIAGYVDKGSSQDALRCVEEMQLEGILPDSVIFSTILKACSSLREIQKGWALHSMIIGYGFEQDNLVAKALLSMYASCSLLSDAHHVFIGMSSQDASSWTALISGYADHGAGLEALHCFKEMQVENVSPDTVSFSCALKACGSMGMIQQGQELHMDILYKGFEGDTSVSNSLVDMYAKCGLLVDARKVFDRLHAQDFLSWTALILGYTEQGASEEVMRCFEKVQTEGVLLDSVMCACTLQACGSIGALDKGQVLHATVVLGGFDRVNTVSNSLIGMYAKCGLLEDAQKVFDSLLDRDVMSWNALLAACSESELSQEALHIFKKMQQEGVLSDAITFTHALKACAGVGAIDQGRALHTEITMKGCFLEFSVGNSLINMYAKCGSLVEAHEVFDKLPFHDVVAWSSLIKGFGLAHEGEMAVQCFEDMQDHGVRPHTIAFSCLLAACSHTSLVGEGQLYFKKMREMYSILPTSEHYSCMVDLFARSGHLFEAEMFLEVLCTSSVQAWGALLSACKAYGEIDLGLRCLQQLVQMDTKVASWYTLLVDIYSSAGRWQYAYKLEELRKYVGARKKIGSASIEINNRLHEFVAGSNPSQEILDTVKRMSFCMKEEGHVPKLDMVLKPIPDIQKEEALCEHAEKFAIAFGLLSTPQGETLRVSKNLRMCSDCHNATKIISKIEKREIILRDNCGIHHFKEGLCSCGEMF